MDENNQKTTEAQGQENQEKTEQTNPAAKKSKKHSRWHIRSPFYREEVTEKAPDPESAAQNEGEPANDQQAQDPKPKKKGKFRKILRGVGTGLTVVAVGLAGYGRWRYNKDHKAQEGEFVDISDDEDDSEENRTLNLPPMAEESEANKKKKSEETAEE
jgi:hypothetical protein